MATHVRARNFWGHFWRYLFIGALSAVVDYAVYISLTRGTSYFAEHLVLANAIAFLVANAHSFYWNRRWNFGATRSVGHQYPVFVAVSLVYLGLIQLIFWWLITHLSVFDLLAKAIAIGISLSVYFLVLRQWVFAEASVEPKEV